MLEALASAIRDEDDEVKGILEAGFKTATQWRTYIQNSFGAPPDVNSLLTTTGRWVGKNTSLQGFQALFVACWICYPGKGLLDDLFARESKNLKRAPSLDKRWPSHVSEPNARTAGQGFRFLQGYRELLVQVEGEFLFLKAEGHPANDVNHVSRYFTKVQTGAENMASVALNNLVQ